MFGKILHGTGSVLVNSTAFKAVVRSEELLWWVRFPRSSANRGYYGRK